ncbi:hypothetical protein P691DRAFT_852465 [Macrolepiota fuliginosa MF-IS2]|uniref:G domain-containing protein n=1 Tax=Macrolepiota fuliginosa MF-IS2 TaxID=1400762 RepID=A0A9P5XDP6_9AGAR|nr:hypothetical protein P691DRAFT_852465 [Macrolepiota fuliginosa MF-IS2]
MDIPTEKLRSEDIIIAVMGPTGTGKSHFIDVLTRQKPGTRSGNELKSHTSEVQSTILEKYEGNQNLVLVDTPGFDDTERSDMEILDMISKWLEKTYRKKIKLTGILYLHRITDNRMAGTPLRNLRLFGELCGDVAMGRVALVTTMWDKLRRPEAGEKRENELRENFWRGMLEKGSTVSRFDNTLNGAEEIIQGLIVEKNKRETLLLQEELVDLKRRLNETHAGQMLYSTLQRLLDDQKNAIEKLIAQIEAQADRNPQLIEKLRKEQEKIEEELEKTLVDVRRLKVPLSRRIILFFFGRKGKISVAEGALGVGPGPGLAVMNRHFCMRTKFFCDNRDSELQFVS